MANIRYYDAVFKIPDGGRVKVLLGGDVEFLNPRLTRASAGLANIKSLWQTGHVYEYGWMPLNKLDSGWESLFENALFIKYR